MANVFQKVIALPKKHLPAFARAGQAASLETKTGCYVSRLPRLGAWLASQRGRWNSGVAAVEMAVAAPILITMLMGIIQLGAIFFLHNNMGNAAREASRALAIGSISTQSEVQSLVQGRLVNWGVAFTVATTLPDPTDPDDTDYTVTVSAPMSEAAIIDFLGLFENRTLQSSVTMREDA